MSGAKRASRNVAIATLGQLAIMAAIVATLAYFPLGLALIFLVRIAGLSYQALLTFGGSFGTFVGLVVWWLLVFSGAFIYTAFVFPWGDKEFGWPGQE